MENHPVVIETRKKRSADVQLKIADLITKLAGSMKFVYIHAIVFIIWCGTGLFGADKFPFNFLTMAVSLEAIFLSTFVMIGQNRQAEFSQKKADHDYEHQVKELSINTDLTREIHKLVKEINIRIPAKG